MSIFSNKVFERKYDLKYITCFYELVLQKYPEAVLIWKKGTKVLSEDERYKSDTAEIHVNFKKLFVQTDNGQGAVDIDVIPKEELVDICRKMDLIEKKPDISVGFFVTVLYAVILVTVAKLMMEDLFSVLIICLLILLTGLIGLYISVMTGKTKRVKVICSVVYFIGALGLAPLSLMTIVFYRNILQLDFYNLLHK